MIPRYNPCFDINEFKSLFSQNKDAVSKFEEEFARKTGYKYAVSFPYGRSAFYSILKALDISNSEIIIPSYTCMVVPSTIVLTDNYPIFANVSMQNFNICVEDIKNKITKKTKIVIPTNTYGYPVDIKSLREELPEDVIIINDLAQHLQLDNNDKWSDAQFYSFCTLKPIYASNGGLVTTNNKEIFDKIKIFHDTMFYKTGFKYDIYKTCSSMTTFLRYNSYFYKFYSYWYLNHLKNLYGANFDNPKKHIYGNFFQSMISIQAKIGLSQLKKLPKTLQKRQKIAKYYNDRLENLSKDIVTPPIIDNASYSMYTLKVKNRDKFIKYLWKKGIDVDRIYPYSMPYFSCFKDYLNQECQNSLKLSQEVVNLPSFPTLIDNPKKLDYIVSTIQEYVKKFG